MGRTKIIGILNITPDSFSDAGLYFDKNSAIYRVHQLIADGADIIDIGAESTRPGAIPITIKEELYRLNEILPEAIKIIHKNNRLVSIDSYKAETISFALQNNVDIINDQKGLQSEEKINLASHYKKHVIIMHSVTIPTDRSIHVSDDIDIMQELKDFATKKIHLLSEKIDKQQIIFDPGLGFGKTFDQCFEILNRIDELKSLQIKLCIGHSRKGFLRSIGNENEMTLATSAFLSAKNIDFIRVHDVKSHKELISRLFY